MPRLRLLLAVRRPVPGISHASQIVRWIAGSVRADIDVVSVKAHSLSHVERLGKGCIYRVPLSADDENVRQAAFARALVRQIESERYDVVHLIGCEALENVIALRDEHEFRLVVTPTRLEKAPSLDRADGVLVDTETARSFFGVPSAQIIRTAVDSSRFVMLRSLPDDEFRVLIPWSDEINRDAWNPLFLILQEFQRRVPARFLFAGELDPSERSEFRAELRSRGLEHSVRGDLTDSLSTDLLLGAHAALFGNTDSEVLPTFFAEAMAAGCCVIAPKDPRFAELIVDDVDGLLYDQASLLKRLLAAVDPNLRSRLSAAARERAQLEYDPARCRSGWQDFYEALAPQSQRIDPWLRTDADGEPLSAELSALNHDRDSSVWRIPTGEQLSPLVDEPTKPSAPE